jgi:hypothetical protein
MTPDSAGWVHEEAKMSCPETSVLRRQIKAPISHLTVRCAPGKERKDFPPDSDSRRREKELAVAISMSRSLVASLTRPICPQSVLEQDTRKLLCSVFIRYARHNISYQLTVTMALLGNTLLHSHLVYSHMFIVPFML